MSVTSSQADDTTITQDDKQEEQRVVSPRQDDKAAENPQQRESVLIEFEQVMARACNAFELMHEDAPQYNIHSRFKRFSGAYQWLHMNFMRHEQQIVHHAKRLMKQQQTDLKILVKLQNDIINWPYDYDDIGTELKAFEGFFAKAVGISSSQIHICFSAMHGGYGGTLATVCLYPKPKEFDAVLDKVTRETFLTKEVSLGQGRVLKLTHGDYHFLESLVVSEWGWLGAFWDWTKNRDGREFPR